METEHIPVEMARAYLLGTLPDKTAAAVEEWYFVSRSHLLEMKAAERRLIEDYLDGALAPDELRQFEARYLRRPVLKHLVDQAERERAGGGGRQRFRLVWAAGVLCLATVCIWVYVGRRGAPTRVVTSARSAPLLAAITLRLTPGVNKGAGDRNARIPLPPEHASVRLIAELPGVRAPIDCAARLSLVAANGGWTQVWSAAPARTVGGDAGQELVLLLPPGTLHPGDYVLEAALPDGRVRETYVFHVSSPQ